MNLAGIAGSAFPYSFIVCNRSINPVLADGFFQEAEAEAGEQFHGSSAS